MSVNIGFFGNPLANVILFKASPGSLPGSLNITNNHDVLTLPVNCVLDGQQREPVSKLMGLDGAITGPMRGIFKE